MARVAVTVAAAVGLALCLASMTTAESTQTATINQVNAEGGGENGNNVVDGAATATNDGVSGAAINTLSAGVSEGTGDTSVTADGIAVNDFGNGTLVSGQAIIGGEATGETSETTGTAATQISEDINGQTAIAGSSQGAGGGASEASTLGGVAQTRQSRLDLFPFIISEGKGDAFSTGNGNAGSFLALATSENGSTGVSGGSATGTNNGNAASGANAILVTQMGNILKQLQATASASGNGDTVDTSGGTQATQTESENEITEQIADADAYALSAGTGVSDVIHNAGVTNGSHSVAGTGSVDVSTDTGSGFAEGSSTAGFSGAAAAVTGENVGTGAADGNTLDLASTNSILATDDDGDHTIVSASNLQGAGNAGGAASVQGTSEFGGDNGALATAQSVGEANAMNETADLDTYLIAASISKGEARNASATSVSAATGHQAATNTSNVALANGDTQAAVVGTEGSASSDCTLDGSACPIVDGVCTCEVDVDIQTTADINLASNSAASAKATGVGENTSTLGGNEISLLANSPFFRKSWATGSAITRSGGPATLSLSSSVTGNDARRRRRRRQVADTNEQAPATVPMTMSTVRIVCTESTPRRCVYAVETYADNTLTRRTMPNLWAVMRWLMSTNGATDRTALADDSVGERTVIVEHTSPNAVTTTTTRRFATGADGQRVTSAASSASSAYGQY